MLPSAYKFLLLQTKFSFQQNDNTACHAEQPPLMGHRLIPIRPATPGAKRGVHAAYTLCRAGRAARRADAAKTIFNRQLAINGFPRPASLGPLLIPAKGPR